MLGSLFPALAARIRVKKVITIDNNNNTKI
jgi:hypothetical protein